MTRPNLDVMVGTHVGKVVIENGRAAGITIARNGAWETVRADKEVIVAGGAINSPQLLMLSGVGDPDVLGRHGIHVVSPLKGVGQNLLDHTSAALVFRRKEPGPFQRNLRLDRVTTALARAYLGAGGFAADLPFGITAFLKSQPSEPIPDVQMLFWMGNTNTASPYLQPFKKPLADSVSVRMMPMRPESRGHIELVSTDPTQAVKIHQNFLGTEAEWQTIRRGLRMIRDLVKQPALASYLGDEVAPGAACASDEQLDEHVRKTMITVHHPVGTCRMGRDGDEMAVLDAQMKVRGVMGLRVVDASAMPDLVAGAINAPVIMMAEKAADMIRGRAPLPAAELH